jgi:sugar transferase (PEP-CTERM system associated)
MSILVKNIARIPLVLLGLAEATVLFVSVYVAELVVLGSIEAFGSDSVSIAPKAAVLSSVMLISLIAMGLYQFNQRAYYHEIIVRIIVGIAFGTIVLAAAYYFFPRVNLEPRIAATAVFGSFGFLLLIRLLFLRLVDNSVFRRRTLIYGAGQRANAIVDLRRRADRRGFCVVGTIPAPGDKYCNDRCAQLIRQKSLLQAALEKNADEIVIAMDDRRENLPVRELLDAKLRGIEIIDLSDFLERETGKIDVDLVNPANLIFSAGFRQGRLSRVCKRVFDVVVALVSLLVAVPVMLAIVIAIKFEDGLAAPAIYRQERVGKKGQIFTMFKFRSMQVGAEPDGEPVWAQENDARITRVGSILRKLRMDELPQLFNVLSGEMSIVGPRPERAMFVSALSEEIPYYKERHSIKPGLTGWAQLRFVYGATKHEAKEKLRYDLYYVKNHSLLLDLVIMIQTAEVILWGKGAR